MRFVSKLSLSSMSGQPSSCVSFQRLREVPRPTFKGHVVAFHLGVEQSQLAFKLVEPRRDDLSLSIEPDQQLLELLVGHPTHPPTIQLAARAPRPTTLSKTCELIAPIEYGTGIGLPMQSVVPGLIE